MKKLLIRYPLARRLLYPVRPTAQDVTEFWDYMCSRHGVTAIDEADPKQARIVDGVLDAMGVFGKHEFRKHYSTTVLSSFRGIYIPFKPGVLCEDYDLWQQMRVCVHEIDHVTQADLKRELGYSWDYLTNHASRAAYEGDAFRSDVEMEWRYRGRLLYPYVLSIRLIHYNCTSLDCENIEKKLEDCMPVIKSDTLTEPASKEAAVWLDERYGRACPSPQPRPAVPAKYAIRAS